MWSIHVPGRAAKHFSLVPFQVNLTRPVFGVDRLSNSLSVKSHQPLLESMRTVYSLGNVNFAVGENGESPPVKDFVVQDTEGETIVHGFRTAKLVPFYVSSLQAQGLILEPDIESANSAPEFVCGHHNFPEF